MLITRNSIANKNLTFYNYVKRNGELDRDQYSYDQLCNMISSYKKYFTNKFNVVPGQKILIGMPPSIFQLAIFIMAQELGLNVCIVDYQRHDDWADENYIDPKTRLLLPIEYLVLDGQHETVSKKQITLGKICTYTIDIRDILIEEIIDDDFISDENTNSIICTSSGTTGTPKVILHTHSFISSLGKRNSVMYDGSVGFSWNLNHGSSLGTFFIPSLLSERVTEIHFFIFDDFQRVISKYHIDHYMIPYSHWVERVLGQTQRNLKTKLYTLSTIKSDWLPKIKNNTFIDIISIFGSNETSGPVFLNKASVSGFRENRYFAIDDFYKIELENDKDLSVTLPVYNKTIKTNDVFKKSGNSYYHEGRNDLYRVNGLAIDVPLYKHFIEFSADLVIDTAKDSLYLAVWDDKINVGYAVEQINIKLKEISKGLHSINKYKLLRYEDFLSGVKLDQEMLRDYFRNYV
jgi:hypothetical protein